MEGQAKGWKENFYSTNKIKCLYTEYTLFKKPNKNKLPN